jgi:predicted nucleic acid-binding protein
MAKLLLDTSAYIRLIEQPEADATILEGVDGICLSVISLGELLTGLVTGPRAQARQAALEAFLHEAEATILPVDEAVAASYALLFSDARKRGRMIPTNDLWIGATALAYDLTILTADEHFAALPIECLLLD